VGLRKIWGHCVKNGRSLPLTASGYFEGERSVARLRTEKRTKKKLRTCLCNRITCKRSQLEKKGT